MYMYIHIFVYHMDVLEGCVHNLPLLAQLSPIYRCMYIFSYTYTCSFPYVQPYIHTFMYMHTCIYVCVYGGAEGAGGGGEGVDKKRAMMCVFGNCVS